MRILAASNKDKAGVLKLYSQFNEDRLSAGATNNSLLGDDASWANVLTDPDCRAYVAKEKDQVIGFITLRVPSYNPFKRVKKLGEVDLLVVHKTFRRKGIGRELFTYSMKYFRSYGVSHVLLNVRVSNRAGLLFWSRMGFKKMTESEFEHDSGKKEKLVYMMRRL